MTSKNPIGFKVTDSAAGWNRADFDDVFIRKDCFLEGGLWTWGFGADGRLGNNSTTSVSSPIQTISGGTNWRQVSIGGFSTSAIKTDGTLWTWGFNSAGALGNNTSNISASSPVQTISGGTDWRQVSRGNDNNTGAIKTDGSLWVWGANFRGQLGDGSIIAKSSPVQTVSSGTNWRQVSVGQSHTGAVKTDGTLWLWGCGWFGRIGNGLNFTHISSPVQTISGGTDWKQVSVGRVHSGAIKTNGTLWTWGSNHDGQLGNGNRTAVNTFTAFDSNANWAFDTDGTSYYQKASTGNYHAAAIKNDGTLWLWGSGSGGILGTGIVSNTSSPVQTISGGTNWRMVSAGRFHDAAIKTDGTLWLWGVGQLGRLGTGTVYAASSPVQTISGGTNWRQVNVGEFHTTAIKTDGTLWAWGPGYYGTNGNNSTIDISSPVQTVSGGNNWKQVSSGRYISAAVKTDGTLWLWGANCHGIIGNNTVGINRSSPVQTISGGTNWKQVSVGRYVTAAIKTDGTLWSWGGCGTFYQNHSAFGDDGNQSRSSPVQTVSGGTNWKVVSASYAGAAAIKTDGTLWTWGLNSGGRAGGRSIGSFEPSQRTTPAATGWCGVYTNSGWFNSGNSMAVRCDNNLLVTGVASYGILGPNISADVCYGFSSPAQTVSGGNNWKQISVGGCATAAIKTDGSLWLWGMGQRGELGTNSRAHFTSPVQTVSGGLNWKSVSKPNIYASAAVKTDGTLWMWGTNFSGVLATNNLISHSSPVQTVSGGTGWKQVEVSCVRHTAAIREDCW
jgi:alpha-tubulin suppressor-like RCC1 family protein